MKLEKDKVYHFLVSMFLVFGIYSIIRNLWLSVVIAFLIGLGKEIKDKIDGRTDCLEDMVANLLGIIVAQVVMWEIIGYNIIRMIK